MYSKPGFAGRVVLDRSGPLIVNNKIWRNDHRYKPAIVGTWPAPLASMFPPRVREWSKSNMHAWTNGSVKVSCGRR